MLFEYYVLFDGGRKASRDKNTLIIVDLSQGNVSLTCASSQCKINIAARTVSIVMFSCIPSSLFIHPTLLMKDSRLIIIDHKDND